MNDSVSYLFRATFHRPNPEVDFLATERDEPILTENDEIIQTENNQNELGENS